MLGLGTGCLRRRRVACAGRGVARCGFCSRSTVTSGLPSRIGLASLRLRTARVEFVNLAADSAIGGFWIAAMGFSPLPSALLATMLSIDKIVVRLAFRQPHALALSARLRWRRADLRLARRAVDRSCAGAREPAVPDRHPLAIATVTLRWRARCAAEPAARRTQSHRRVDRTANRKHWQDAGRGRAAPLPSAPAGLPRR